MIVYFLFNGFVGKQHRCKSPEDCGLKARCKTKNGSKLGVCVCERDYIGDPRVECERKCQSLYLRFHLLL